MLIENTEIAADWFLDPLMHVKRLTRDDIVDFSNQLLGSVKKMTCVGLPLFLLLNMTALLTYGWKCGSCKFAIEVSLDVVELA